MMRIGWGELLVVVAIVVLIVGARRLPDIGRSLGEAIREFQKALRGKPRGGGSSGAQRRSDT